MAHTLNIKLSITIVFILTNFIHFSNSQTNPYKTIAINNEHFFLFPEFEEIDDTPDLAPSEIYRLHNGGTNISLDGKWVKLYDTLSSKIAGIFEIKHNLLDGSFVLYHFNGNIYLSGSYFKNLKVGAWKYYYENGNPYKLENYNIEQTKWGMDYYRFGSWNWWDEKGILRSESEYDSSGFAMGKWITRNNRGGNELERDFAKGQFNGMVKGYFGNGNVKFNFEYKDNFSIDNGKTFYESGELESTGKTFIYCKIGKWDYFYKSGSKQASGDYKLHMTVFCMSSVPNEYYHSTKNGRWVYKYENGNIMAFGDYYSQIEQTSRGDIYKSKMAPGWTFFDNEGNLTNLQSLKNFGITFIEDEDSFIPVND